MKKISTDFSFVIEILYFPEKYFGQFFQIFFVELLIFI